MKNAVILVTRMGMGSGDAALQMKLITTYVKLLLENDALPGAICFYTDGVRLVVEGSPILESLKELEARGVHLVLCRTCLEHYGLLDQVRVGVVGGMGDIVAAQAMASKVVTI
jgi:intracellular sulfur oxidation DsrE/DsrF family protein